MSPRQFRSESEWQALVDKYDNKSIEPPDLVPDLVSRSGPDLVHGSFSKLSYFTCRNVYGH